VRVEQVCARLGVTADDLAAYRDWLAPNIGEAALRVVRGDGDQGL
jgi:hypothetical protein